jgi:hypothetical protein
MTAPINLGMVSINPFGGKNAMNKQLGYLRLACALACFSGAGVRAQDLSALQHR